MTTVEHGQKYEIYVKTFIKNKYEIVWLWNEIPIEILHTLNIIEQCKTSCNDIGCDILAKTVDGTYHFIQCKNYSTTGVDNTISIYDLAGFYNFMAENNFINGYVYYSGILSSQVKCRSKLINYVCLPYSICESIKIAPYIYQIDAYNKLSINGRNTLTMPCGTGKTYISYMLSLHFDNVIILSPLISTSEQLYKYYKQYYSPSNVNISLYNCKSKNKFINKTGKNIIISTYDSVNLIYDKIICLYNKLIIIDEYHNLSINALNNYNEYMNKLLTCTDNYLFMSATPHKHKSRYTHIFGSNEYYLSWDDAIKNKYICDYKFYYPNAEKLDNKIIALKSTYSLSNIEMIKSILINKAYYLLECIKQCKLRKIIVFLKSINESHDFTRILKVLNIYFELKININEINCNTSNATRNKYITRFTLNNEFINILCNVHILDEGIDIPECDSVYITHPNNNAINFIQRISRCNRLKKDGPNIANVIIWAKTEHKIINIDKLISDYICIKYGQVPSEFIYGNICDPVHSYEIVSTTLTTLNNENNNSYNDTTYNGFVIDIDIIAKWLNTLKKHIKKTLLESYQKNIDYKINIQPPNGRGRPSEQILLTLTCFKRLCMMSKTTNAESVRNYLFQTKEHLLIPSINNKIINALIA